MAIDNAKAFVELLKKDKELQTMFQGFNLEELASAIKQAKAELSDEDLDKVAGGFCDSWF